MCTLADYNETTSFSRLIESGFFYASMYSCTRLSTALPSAQLTSIGHLQVPVARVRVICHASSATRESLKLPPEMGVGSSSSAPTSSKRDAPDGCAVPPWILHGRGYVFPFVLPKDVAGAHSTYAEDPRELVKFVGGVGGFVLSDYWDSPVGPYKELVFLPGRYQYDDAKRAHAISRIWVDNEKSVRDARVNWNIPKEFAEFEWREPSASQAGRVTVRRRGSDGRRGEVIFDAAICDSYAPVSVPFRTKVPLLPLDFLDLVPLVQLPLDGGDVVLKTTLSVAGWVKPAAMADKPRVDAAVLPAVGALYGLSLPSFELQFKEPLSLLPKAQLHKSR